MLTYICIFYDEKGLMGLIYTDRFIKGLITVGLVLLISIQIMMRFDVSKNYLMWVESQVHDILGHEVQEVAVLTKEDYVIIKLLNSGSYSQARVMVNNERAYYFTKPTLKIPVNDGDLLILDTRCYSEGLWFEIIDVSDQINNLQYGQQFRVKKDLQSIMVEIGQRSKF